MTEQTDSRQLFIGEVKGLIETIRNSLCGQNITPELLADSGDAVSALKNAATDADVDSFRLIADCLEIVLNRHVAAQSAPSRVELETVELAVDWLDQLLILYREDIPEPKSLVAELLNTFDLVERSQGAVSLVELVNNQAGQGESPVADPFSDDPDFAVDAHSAPEYQDPFAEDPGFGLEFDLLQRTINFVVASGKLDDDPFNDDPPFQED
ncbi:MAG: hypothetical protein U9Q61_02600 [Thermodesulfobacteriota bacterium]|nr:hypothetical protein [Thermodesulfobacteriota bacterium]